MPPSPNNVDGIRPPATAPTGPPQRPPEPEADPKTNTLDLKAEAAEIGKQAAMPKSKPKVSKKNNGPVVTILLTLIIMVLLIGLAYYAYSKSK